MPHTAFLGINLDLLNNPKYNKVSFLAKGLYSLYADRSTCSEYSSKNGDTRFIDKNGVFVFYTNEEAGSILGVTGRTISNLRKELVAAELIDVKRNGLTGYKIYVKPVSTTPKDIEWKMAWKKNVEIRKESYAVSKDLNNKFSGELNSNVVEDFSVTSGKKHTLSDSQFSISNNTRETNVTKETGGVEKISPADSSQTHEELALEGLKDRVSGIIGIRAWGKIHMIAQGSYDKAKELVDTIYKAKKQVSQRVRYICKKYWDLPEISDVAYDSVYFEKNDLLAKGIESALLRIIEIHYKTKCSEIKNFSGFMYTFLRNALSQNVELYIEENTNGYYCLQDVAQYVHNTLNFKTA